jgi:hypothetical protein
MRCTSVPTLMRTGRAATWLCWNCLQIESFLATGGPIQADPGTHDKGSQDAKRIERLKAQSDAFKFM